MHTCKFINNLPFFFIIYQLSFILNFLLRDIIIYGISKQFLLNDQGQIQKVKTHNAGRQLLPCFNYQGFDPRFQTGGFKKRHFNQVKSALFLYPILK